MGLDALLARMEGRAVTSITPDQIVDVTSKPAPRLACTRVTSVTAENGEGESDFTLGTACAATASRWWRFRVTTAGGRILEVDYPSGATVAEVEVQYPDCKIELLARLPQPRADRQDLDAFLAAACAATGLPPAAFRTLLSPDDLADIEAGDIPLETLLAYAASMAEGVRAGRLVVLKAPDASGDDRRHCLDCANLSPIGRCRAYAALGATRRYRPLDDLPKRCVAYQPNDPDQRPGRERWPTLVRR